MDIYQELRREIKNLKQKYPDILRGKPGDLLYWDDDGCLCIAIPERTSNRMAGIETGDGGLFVHGYFTFAPRHAVKGEIIYI